MENQEVKIWGTHNIVVAYNCGIFYIRLKNSFLGFLLRFHTLLVSELPKTAHLFHL